MNKLPLTINRIIDIHKNKGMQYTASTNFCVGTPQPTVLECCGLIMMWTGQIDNYGYYLYKNFSKCFSLRFV